MNKVLVTGGAGFIGSHICDRLVDRGDEVLVLDNFSSGQRSNLRHLADEITLIEDSVRNLQAHRDKLEGLDRIFHLAARISGHNSLQEPDAFFDTNLKGLARLTELLEELEGCRMIFASSSTIYGNQRRAVYQESDPADPPTVYALTKRSGEQLLELYSRLHGFEYVCLRLFNVYGPRQNPDHPYANVACKFAEAAATDQQIKLFGDGEQSRDFIHVDDVVDAFMAVEDDSDHRIYNVGTGRATTINELIAYCQEISGESFEIERCDPWPNDIRAIRADISRIRREMAFEPEKRLEQGLAETVAYFQEQS